MRILIRKLGGPAGRELLRASRCALPGPFTLWGLRPQTAASRGAAAPPGHPARADGRGPIFLHFVFFSFFSSYPAHCFFSRLSEGLQALGGISSFVS